MLPDPTARLTALYPVLAELPASERQRVLAHHTQHIVAPAGAILFHEGSPCQGFPMVLSGAVRVARGSPGGRTLELYRVTPGELCVISTSCLFGRGADEETHGRSEVSSSPSGGLTRSGRSGGTLSAHGQAVAATELVLLSPQGLDKWCRFEPFRRFVFAIFAERLADLMSLAEAIAFQRLDQRLAQALLGHGACVQTTHQALADNLGTVREIVSRLLSRFERDGWVRLSRERIDVVDAAGLRAVAAGQAHEAAR
jgi:CRP/FNR family transcriptional regulator